MRLKRVVRHAAAGVAAILIALAQVPALAAADAPSSGPRCAEQAGEVLTRDGFAAAVQRNAPAVVQVVVLRGSRDPMEEAEGFEFFQPLQGLPLPGGDTDGLERTFSSGFIVDASGIVLASAHAVFDAREIRVLTADGRRHRASVLGLDRRWDVSVLKIAAQGLSVVRMAPEPPPICPGAWIAAIGTPFGFERTITVGVVSAYPRYLHGSSIALIQTDAALNPGSSGGPLFNAQGELVGMSTMIYSATGIYIGVSFGLPVDELMRVADVLRKGGTLRTGEIGIRTQPVTADLARAFRVSGTAGALVTAVRTGSPAAGAGLKPGDIVLGFARGERLDHASIEARISSARAGSELELQVWREFSVSPMRVKVVGGRAEVPPLRDRLARDERRLGLAIVSARNVAPGATGVYVESATGSALLAGLERGDRVIAVNAAMVNSPADFDDALAQAGTRGVIALLVVRGGATVYVPVSREGLSPD